MTPFRMLLLLACATIAAGCQRTSTPVASASASPAAPSAVVLPEGGGCGGEIGRFRAVVTSDKETGNAGKGVADRALAETDGATAACAAGREGEALRLLAQTKAKFGYR